MSLHPTTTDDEVIACTDAVREIVANYRMWTEEYHYDKHTNEFYRDSDAARRRQQIAEWFSL